MQKKTRRFERTAASVCKEYAILTLATLVMSAGTYLFKFPNNFSFGGVTGLAVVLSAVSPLSRGRTILSSIWHCWCWDFCFWGKALA